MKKGQVNYGIYILPRSGEEMEHFRTESTDTLQRKPHTRRFKTWVYVVDTKGRRKAC